jgi:hypothetical protein
MNIRIFYLLTLILIITAGSCRNGIKSGEPAGVHIDRVEISDYGRALFSLDPMNVMAGLDSLSDEYKFFTGDNPDTLSALQIREFIMDPFNSDLAAKYREKYPDLSFLEDDLTSLFGTIKDEHPEFVVPKVYTYVSGLLFESPVTYLDSIMIIGLDMFLGRDFEPYRAVGLPVYMSKRMEQENIIPECARQIALNLAPDNQQLNTLLDFMIMHGKVLYTMDRYLPGTPDSLKIGYTENQVDWCTENEASVWRLLIDQELLYKSDAFINNRFIQDGPFTAGLPEGSPAMLGRYIGWQIVRSYMKRHPETQLNQLFDIADSQQILSKSGYKPKK